MLRTVHSLDGTAIAFEDRGQGPGSPVVLVHAAGLDRGCWSGVAKLLGTGHRVAMMDRRGRGASGDAEAYSLRREAEDVLAMVAALTREGQPAPVVVGHSYGALVALEAVTVAAEAAAGAASGEPGAVEEAGIAAPPVIGAAVVYEPPLAVEAGEREAADRMIRALDRGDQAQAMLMWLRDVARYPAREVAPLEADPEGMRAAMGHEDTLAREMRAAMAYHLDKERLARIHIPVLLVHGSSSPPLFVHAAQEVQLHIADSALWVLAGQGHNAVMQAPGVVAEALERFLGLVQQGSQGTKA